MKSLFAIALITLVTLHIANARTWTASDGKRTVEGDLIKLDGDVVVLKAKGKVFRIPLTKLSDEDQAYAKANAEKADTPETTAESPGTWTLLGTELKPGGTFDMEGELTKQVVKALSKNKLKPTKIKIKISLPADFDPNKPQKVFWPVGGINNEKERAGGNIAVFSRGKTASSKGWVVIAADTEHGNPRESTVKICEGDDDFHFQVFDEVTKIWPEFKNWKHACGGHSSGAKGSFFRIAQLLKAKANVVGGFFSGCNQSLALLAGEETKVRKGAFKKVKGFQSTGDKDNLVDASQIKSVTKGMKNGGFRKIQSKTFPGGHSTSYKHLAEALDWFLLEE